MSEFNIQASIEAQAKYCEKTGAPHFAPKSGVCWNCKRNIYSLHESKRYGNQIYASGITTEKAGKELVTGCPHCGRTYCD